jgi:RNA polymerase sigma-70 factor, ECF subfamily
MRLVSADSERVMGAHPTPPPPLDQASRRWTEQLRPEHPRRDATVAELHTVLLRIAYHELSRRSAQLGSVSGPEFDDLAQQAADDALVKVLAKLEQFAGLSRFTTWAYKFVMFEISHLVGRHPWQRQAPHADESVWERLADSPMADPARRTEQREQLATLAAAVERLTARQREVFVAVALNDVPIDVLAFELGSTRNAIYKNLFDARRSLRRSMAADGHPVFPEDRSRD